ncbi:hypothetical protein G6L37_34680 [Agrobacterium rubi]|nr:hypothetical protein [Agrobacterium rubi]NTF23714.1 hypothetical protein [Agrobacterium rubi]
MSTYYSYYLRAPLKDPSIASVERFREIAAEADVYFDITSGPIQNVSVLPHFGKSTVYKGSDFHFEGMSVSDGILRIGVFASNLERSDADYNDPDRVGEPDARQRIERLMEFLSHMTTGDIGEIHGTFGSEYIEYFHGHPIIRCADGGLRILRTDSKDEYDWYHGEGDPQERYEGPLVTITDTIPSELVGDYENGAFLVDIHDELVARLRQSTPHNKPFG